MRIPKIFLVAVVLVLIIFSLSLFRISKVEIEAKDINCSSLDEIQGVLNLKDQNFFIVQFTNAEKAILKKFYCIKSVKFEKFFPNKIKVDMEGRLPLANLIATPSGEFEDNFLFDEEGVVFSKDNIPYLPKIYLSNFKPTLGQKLWDERMQNIIFILDRARLIKLDILEAWVKDNFLEVQTVGPKIIFRTDNDMDIQLASLQLILGEAKIDFSNLEFIDLRFDKPVVRFAPKK